MTSATDKELAAIIEALTALAVAITWMVPNSAPSVESYLKDAWAAIDKLKGGDAMTDNRTTELLPCKKCGGEAEIVPSSFVSSAFSDASCVARCRACGNHTDRWYSDEDAAESWNRRNGNE